MKTLGMRSQWHILSSRNPTPSSDHPVLVHTIRKKDLKHPTPFIGIGSSKSAIIPQQTPLTLSLDSIDKQLIGVIIPRYQKHISENNNADWSYEYSRYLIMGAVSAGFVLLLMGLDDQKALALGPEGPLVEEFWDNVRRYALYALTVSTGAIYTIFQPILELLKNPISAILILVILGGSIYLVSQVVSAMVGISEFPYDYGY